MTRVKTTPEYYISPAKRANELGYTLRKIDSVKKLETYVRSTGLGYCYQENVGNFLYRFYRKNEALDKAIIDFFNSPAYQLVTEKLKFLEEKRAIRRDKKEAARQKQKERLKKYYSYVKIADRPKPIETTTT